MDSLLFRPATEAAALVRRGAVLPADLADALRARIDAVGKTVNAVVALRDGGPAVLPAGPLRGVPVTVKEAIDVAGMRTTWGVPGLPDAVAVASVDASVVRRLRSAGADVVGKTNVAAQLGDVAASANEVYGATANPYDPDRTPGGSSGGSAAALAAGQTFLEYGSDLAGSVRIPAALCGVYGLRPTARTVPLTGFAPPGAPRVPTEQAYLSTLGPLARDAADLRVALRVTGGPDWPAAAAYAWHLAPPRHRALPDFRVGVVLDAPQAPVSAEVGAVLSAVVDAVAAAGATVVTGWPPGVDPEASAAAFGDQLGAFFTLQGADDGGGATLGGFAAREADRMATRLAWQRHFADVDVVLLPVTPVPAPRHGEPPGGDLAWWTTHAALAGLPSLSAPVGQTPGGLPVGVQVVGPPHEDDTAITFAQLLAGRIGGFRPPPL